MKSLLSKAASITNEIADKIEISIKDGKYSIREKNTGLFVGFDSKDNIVKNIFEKL